MNYQIMKIEKLPRPFKTACTNYSIKSEPFFSEADCLTKCNFENVSLLKGMFHARYFFKDKAFYKNYKHFINTEFLPPNFTPFSSLKLTNYKIMQFLKKQLELLKICRKKCPTECISTNYVISENDETLPANPKSPLIGFEHDDNYDIYLKHMPLMDWETFLANVGGLAGMWVGFSFMHLPNEMKKLFSLLAKLKEKTRRRRGFVRENRRSLKSLVIS